MNEMIYFCRVHLVFLFIYIQQNANIKEWTKCFQFNMVRHYPQLQGMKQYNIACD